AQQVAGFCTAHVLDAGIFERRPFIVSEYVGGPSLVEVIQQHGPRTGAVLERIAVATLTALGAVHAVGMVHRDFKPGNVLLGPDGPVGIDFGMASVPGMTTTGLSGQAAVGTPAYMAPEQLSGNRVTAAPDMWAWAVSMTFAATVQLPVTSVPVRPASALACRHSSGPPGLRQPSPSFWPPRPPPLQHGAVRRPPPPPSAHRACPRRGAAGSPPPAAGRDPCRGRRGSQLTGGA